MAFQWSARWNEKSRTGLILSVLIAVGVAVGANAFVFVANPQQQAQAPPYRLQPPGYVIGIVWVFLFAAMGAARWLVASREDGRGKGSLPVLLLVLFCASYPLYTLALSSLTLGLIGNAATALFALWVAARVRPVSRLAAGLVTAPAVWVAFASYLIAEQMLGRSI